MGKGKLAYGLFLIHSNVCDPLSINCSTPLRPDPIGGSEPVMGCSINSFYLPFY